MQAKLLAAAASCLLLGSSPAQKIGDLNQPTPVGAWKMASVTVGTQKHKASYLWRDYVLEIVGHTDAEHIDRPRFFPEGIGHGQMSWRSMRGIYAVTDSQLIFALAGPGHALPTGFDPTEGVKLFVYERIPRRRS